MRIGMKILHVIFFLLLLGSGDFQVRGMTVTGKDVPIEALRGEDVTIPCLLSGVPIPLNLQKVSVVWSRRLQNGTEYKVYHFQDSHHQSSRPGSHMNDRDLQQGKASLSIPNIQITDEGEYRCFVIVTPDSDSATSTLQVSVIPQTKLSPDKHIEAGIKGSVFCEVSNFYPEAVKVRWVKYRKSTNTSSSSDEDVYLTTPLRNSDGTFKVTSLLTGQLFGGANPGDVLSCIVSHRSLKEEITLSFIIPRWSSYKDVVLALFALCVITFITYILKHYFKKGKRPWIHVVLGFIFMVLCIVIIIISIYMVTSLIYSLIDSDDVSVWICIAGSGLIITYLIGMHNDMTFLTFFKSGEPSLSEISGDPYILHMKKTTLTCQLTNFKQKEIQINVYLTRLTDIKKQQIAHWELTDRPSSIVPLMDLAKTGDQNTNNSHVLGAERSASLDVQMEVKITKSFTGMYSYLCSIPITLSADTDNKVLLVVEVAHASLKWPIYIFRLLTVYKGNKPSFTEIMEKMEKIENVC